MIAIPEALGLTLGLIHFGAPLAYYFYLKRWLGRPWNLRVDPSYAPKIAVVVPTYNEAKLIEGKLDDVYAQDYPRDKMEVIVVDSASSDGTPGLVEEWAGRHGDLKVKLIVEPERRGKAHALNEALKHVPGDAEVVVVTDVDSSWPRQDTLRRAVSYFSDPSVGAVSCLKKPAGGGPGGVEEGYRSYYNIIRVAESKAYSTPIFHGELVAYKRELLEEVGGFPEDIGADDSHTATLIALRGYRAIIPEDLWCMELVPREGYNAWRVRRAQHLIQHFGKALAMKPKTPGLFKLILYTEAYLHLVNPWILLMATALLLASAALGSALSLALLALGLLLLVYKPYRVWIAAQAYLVAGAVRNLRTRELAWEKQAKRAVAPPSPRHATT